MEKRTVGEPFEATTVIDLDQPISCGSDVRHSQTLRPAGMKGTLMSAGGQ
jgi:hypothetical protein